MNNRMECAGKKNQIILGGRRSFWDALAITGAGESEIPPPLSERNGSGLGYPHRNFH